MTRATNGKTVLRCRKGCKLTKGYRLGRHHLYRQSVVTLIRGRVYAFRDRRCAAGIPPAVDRAH